MRNASEKEEYFPDVSWIYQDKTVTSYRIEVNPSETIKLFINWSEDSDKKQWEYLLGGG